MLLEKKPESNPKFKSKKQLIGLIYGMASGLFFAIFAWGIDAVLLARANAMYAWIKFIPGLLICLAVGSAVGWLTIYLENHGFSVIIWGAFAILLTTLAIWLPISGTENFIKLLDPDSAQWLNYPGIDSIEQFRIVGFLTIGLASIICGILEINLVDQVMLSSHNSSLVVMLFTCLVIMGLAGSASDYLINIHFREPIQALNHVIQTMVDYGNEEIPVEVAREQHLSAINRLDIDFSNPRRLTLLSFDKTLGNMTVLVNFPDTAFKCTMIYSQASNCSLISDAQ